MCGISGIVGVDDKALLGRMLKVSRYRGPDDSGRYLDKGISLGMNRLSIIDLGGGHQPMSNETGDIWTVFNGEIYNYKGLRTELERKGHRFSSDSDTEVIIHGYEEWGASCVKRFNGIFAFAIWNGKKKELFLARDHLGVKPLYYALTDRGLIFASEIKSILQEEAIKREVDTDALSDYLTLRYVPGPRTMFKGIFKLMPAHTLTCTKGKTKNIGFWDIPQPNFENKSEYYYIEKLRELLKGAVESQLVSDVPLGAYLSGGLDSSAIVALMSSFMKEPVKTFSVGFGYEEYDELSHAKRVSDLLGTDHKEIIVGKGVGKLMPQLVWHLDEPIVDPALIPTYFVSKLAKKQVKVVLIGEGADELFAGYPHYPMLLRRKNIRNAIPAFAKKCASSIIGKGPLLDALTKEEEEHILFGPLFSNGEKKGLCSFREGQNRVMPGYFKKREDALDRMLYVDLKTWLPDNLLLKVDKMTMANSIEARVPYLDTRVVEFASSIPQNMKVRGGVVKYVLRKAARDILPREIVERKKHGFTVPVQKWFGGEMSYAIGDALSSEGLAGFFNRHELEKLGRNVPNPKYAHKLWSLLVFSLWHKIYIEPDRIGLKCKL